MNEIVKVDMGDRDKSGNVILREVLKVDANGHPPLCDCYTAQLFENYNASSGMKPNERERFFETAIIDNENRLHFSQAQNFVKNIGAHLKVGTWLYIYGDETRAARRGVSAYGTGKSYLTHCIGNELTKLKQRAIYVTENELFQEIKNTYRKDANESEADVLNRFYNVPILLIDDLFKSQYKDWAEDRMFHLLENRYCPGRVTIINSNYAPNRVYMAMERNGNAVTSRILGQAALIEMIGTDRRPKKPQRGPGSI
ncbi:DnaA ATPase domain-containing protein [Paenibacillus elgii]|uniref:DnaA ATPase domain-containing protein n=1 Tax=Paenibacillus elgii TaxID=189691 RepID=UPI00203C1475|nr:DnaA/Hda family protein [Paenibacillus elgii]MCM3273686.1 DnaA/Hda family protein [Paenibacillus elgii]